MDQETIRVLNSRGIEFRALEGYRNHKAYEFTKDNKSIALGFKPDYELKGNALADYIEKEMRNE